MISPSTGKKGQRPTRFLALASLAVLLSMAQPAFLSAAGLAEDVAKCSGIADPKERLACFDALGRKAQVAKPAETQPPAPRHEVAMPSILSAQWGPKEATSKEESRIRLYRLNYFLPFSFNNVPNKGEALDVDPSAKAQRTEAEFQFSLKMNLWQDIFGRDADLWLAYTQHSFWQVYNAAFSSPFRETNYEPELFLGFRTDFPFFGLRGRIINFGFDHQSNGRSQPLSRSWNRIVATAGFERGGLNLFLKTWYRIPESAVDDDNPDIERYTGYGELSALYYWKGNRFGAMLRNNLRAHKNRGALQLDWAFPLPFVKTTQFKGYIQYFNGYYNSLIDYNKSNNRIGFGFTRVDW